MTATLPQPSAPPAPKRRRLPRSPLRSSEAAVDERAFTELYRTHHAAIYRYCRSILHDHEDAQDALQMTMSKAFTALQKETRDLELRPWLFAIAHNEAISALRRRRETSDMPADLPDRAPDLADQVSVREDVRQLQADMATLTDKQRSVLVMRELSGLPHAEIGGALGCSAGSVKQTLFEARSALHECREGRAMACEDIRRAISDGDGRTLRGRRLRAHVAGCRECQTFEADLRARPKTLAALAPPLPAAAGAGLLAQLLGGAHGAGSATAGSAAAGSATAGSAAAVATSGGAMSTGAGGLVGGLGAKVVAVVAATGAVAGGTTAVVHHERHAKRAPAAGQSPRSTPAPTAQIRTGRTTAAGTVVVKGTATTPLTTAAGTAKKAEHAAKGASAHGVASTNGAAKAHGNWHSSGSGHSSAASAGSNGGHAYGKSKSHSSSSTATHGKSAPNGTAAHGTPATKKGKGVPASGKAKKPAHTTAKTKTKTTSIGQGHTPSNANANPSSDTTSASSSSDGTSTTTNNGNGTNNGHHTGSPTGAGGTAADAAG